MHQAELSMPIWTLGPVHPRCAERPCVGIHYRGVKWEGGAVDGGSII